MFESRIRCIPHAADDLKTLAREKLAWLDGQMAGREFVCGARLTMADFLLFGFLEFANQMGQPVDPALARLQGFITRMKARPSAAA